MPLLWGLPIAVMLLTGYLVGQGWIMTMGWSVSLAVMGMACLVNARGCGRMHCFFTGPFFLLMAVASLLYGVNVLLLGPHGWRAIGIVLMVGGVGLYFGPEWAWGRYRRARRDVGSLRGENDHEKTI